MTVEGARQANEDIWRQRVLAKLDKIIELLKVLVESTPADG